MLSRINLIILSLSFIFLISCNNDNKPKKVEKDTTKESSLENSREQIAFYINDRPVTRGQIHGPNLERGISNEVIYEMALKQGMDKDQEIIDRGQLYKKNLLVSKIKSKAIKDHLSQITITDEELDTFYEETKNNFARLDLTQIMLDDEQTAHNVYSKIVTSDDIDKTIDEQQKQGIVIITKELKLTRNYDHLFKEIEVGSLTKPVKGTHKYNIYRIDKIDYVPLEQIKQKLRLQLTSKHRLKAIDQYVDSAIKNNNIVIKKVK